MYESVGRRRGDSGTVLLASVKDMASGELDALGNTGGDGDNRAGMCYPTLTLNSVERSSELN
jgi:hypothetical protein